MHALAKNIQGHATGGMSQGRPFACSNSTSKERGTSGSSECLSALAEEGAGFTRFRAGLLTGVDLADAGAGGVFPNFSDFVGTITSARAGVAIGFTGPQLLSRL